MADFNSTSPDIYHQVNNNETLTHYERRLDSFPNVSEKTWKVIIDTEKNVATILVPSETKQETKAISEDFKLKFIEKLKKLPDYEWSKVQEAIEKQTIEIKKIPWRDLFAIYESKIWNLIYITNIEWKKYFNINRVRQWVLRWWLKIWYQKLSWIEEKIENWIYNLYKWNQKIDISSDEYLSIILKSVDMIIQFEKDLGEEIERREKLWIE